MSLGLKVKEAVTKYTVVIPSHCINELKSLADERVIPSVNQGIRVAVENFIIEEQRKIYQQKMREAANDAAFLSRTMKSQQEFSLLDEACDENDS